jgi:hypothetical protein
VIAPLAAGADAGATGAVAGAGVVPTIGAVLGAALALLVAGDDSVPPPQPAMKSPNAALKASVFRLHLLVEMLGVFIAGFCSDLGVTWRDKIAA